MTNEEYLAYWRTLSPADQRRLGFRSNYYPWTWAPFPADPPFPSELARCPVLGVPLAGAEGYARWRGKRLPTPYEWALAALGPKGDAVPPSWALNYIQERRLAWKKIIAAHTEYARQHPELQQGRVLFNGVMRLPWIAWSAFGQPAAEWSKQVIDSVLDEIWNMWREPLYVRPVGGREYDVSPYGAMDMALNASELVMPTPGPPATGNPRYMEMEWVPAKPEPLEPWFPQAIQAMSGPRGLPPLSRLFRRELIGPSPQDILLWSNINEVTQMLWPIAGWRLAMTHDVVATASMWIKGQNPYGSFGRPPGFQLWETVPRHYRREMGREVPLNEAEAHALPGPQLNYYLPVGFRCAR